MTDLSVSSDRASVVKALHDIPMGIEFLTLPTSGPEYDDDPPLPFWPKLKSVTLWNEKYHLMGTPSYSKSFLSPWLSNYEYWRVQDSHKTITVLLS